MGNDVLQIVIPFYNAAGTLGATLDSLRCIGRDRRDDVHVMGVDDGSTDGSAEIFIRHQAMNDGFRWALITRKNGGTAAARNSALSTFDSGWTMFLDADDELILDPYSFLQDSDGRTALVFDTLVCREGRRISRYAAEVPKLTDFYTVLSSRNPFPVSAVIFRRELMAQFFHEDLRFLEDWHFWGANPGIFSDARAFHGTAVSRINVGPANKSASQQDNGRYRKAAVEQMAASWQGQGTLSRVVANNLEIQKAIGDVQMGSRKRWRAFLMLPASVSLYAKLFVYMFMFPLYRSLNPYGSRGGF